MKAIVGQLSTYLKNANPGVFILNLLVLSILIWVNYYYHLNNHLLAQDSFLYRSAGFFLLYLLIFGGSYCISFLMLKKAFPAPLFFYLLLLVTPAIFAIKVSLRTSDFFAITDVYWNTVLMWPLKAMVAISLCWIFWTTGGYKKPFAGLGALNFNITPYFQLLLLMIPLLLIAGTGSDFQQVYPKLKMVSAEGNLAAVHWFKKLLFELSYGLDFFTIELFFRGFVILAFIKYAGKEVILPMAVFYCVIHFGKPVAECISSLFGGLILGVIVYHSRSIWGGLIVHLGIAWMMEWVGILF